MKIGELKYDKVYILNSMGDNFQYELVEKVMDNFKNDEQDIEKVLSLTNEKKLKKIEEMKKQYR